MKEEEILQIQTEQLLEEIKKIEWIVNNETQIIKNLFTKVYSENEEYFNQCHSEHRDPSKIFRGDDFRLYIDWYYRNQNKG